MCTRPWIGHRFLLQLNGVAPLGDLRLHRRANLDAVGLRAPHRITGDPGALAYAQLSSELTQV